MSDVGAEMLSSLVVAVMLLWVAFCFLRSKSNE